MFVPEGFAWAGFIFTFIWALWHRLWVVAALLFSFRRNGWIGSKRERSE